MQTKAHPSTTPAAPALETPEPQAVESRRSPVRNFVRHYAEMLAAMFIGMFVLGAALALPLELMGADVSSWDTEAPGLQLLMMAFTMTVPMVAWMRYRGHGWRPNAEMAASMIVPTIGVIGLLGIGAITDTGTLLILEHVLMLAAMFGVMYLRPEEYSGHHHNHQPHHEPATA